MAASPLASLHPLSFGQMLDQVIRLYRKNFLKFIGIIALVQVPISALQIVASYLTTQRSLQMLMLLDQAPYSSEEEALNFLLQMVGGFGLSTALSLVGLFLIYSLGMGALIRATTDTLLGEPVEILGSYQKVLLDWRPLLGGVGLAILVGGGMLVWAMVPCIGWFTGAGLMAFFTLGVFPLVIPMIVLERLGAIQALRRAWDLARKRFWRVTGVIGVLYLFNMLIAAGPSMLMSFFLQRLSTDVVGTGDIMSIFNTQTIIASVIGMVVGLLFTSLLGVSITVLYFDLRVRLEGFDLAAQTRPELTDRELIALAPRAGQSSLLTWNDVANVTLLSLALVGAYVILYVGLMAVMIGGIGLLTGI